MTDIYDARINYKRATLARDWAQGVFHLASFAIGANTISMADFQSCEDAWTRIIETYDAAFDELEHYETQASLAQGGGRHAGRI